MLFGIHYTRSAVVRFNIVYATSLGLLAVATGGCVSGAGGGGTSVAALAACGVLGPAMLQWTGNFRSLQQETATFGVRGRNIASGTITLDAPDPTQMHVRMRISVPIQDAVRLHWALASGACGSNTIPMMAVAQFPEIAVSNGGGDLDVVMSMPMPTTGRYHANVYNSGTMGQDESEVLTCAELTLQRRGT